MKKLIIYIFSILLLGCDCVQEVEGYVIDDNSKRFIEGVKIWKKQRPEIMNYDLPWKPRTEPPLPVDYKRKIELTEEEKAIIVENIKDEINLFNEE